MASPQEATFTSTSVTYSSYTTVTGTQGQTGCIDKSAQVLRMFAWSDASSGSATARAVFVNKATGTLDWADDAAIAIASPAVRRNLGGTSGDYLCTVTFGSSGSNKLDMMPWRQAADVYEVRIGVPALTTIASLDLIVGQDADI